MKDGSEKLVFGLPGNPVSCMVGFKLVVEPAIKKMSGLPPSKYDLAPITAEIAQPIKMDPARPEFHRATVIGISLDFQTLKKPQL